MNFFGGNYSGGGLNMSAPSGMALRMPTTPSTVSGIANLQAPAGAFDLSRGGMNNAQAASLAMSLMGAAQPQQQEMMPMQQMAQIQPATLGQDTQAFMQQYGLDALLQNQSDDMMRQRMQGLMALLGGQ
jgi:hypothetical protein